MAEGSNEQDKSEEATPFKLQRARRRGMVARGMDLGFLSSLLGLAIASQLAGTSIVEKLALASRRSLAQLIPVATQAGEVIVPLKREAQTVAAALIVPALIIVILIVVLEIVQLRGIVFSAVPLKPDLSRLNPAKGLKRLFSPQMLRQLLKSILKLALYCTAAYFFIRYAADTLAQRAGDGRQLAPVLAEAAGRLLLMFIVLAAFIATVDQLLSRREFAKQMRMSRREITRELREREGEPRQKQKRKQILDEILKQAGAAANVKGADVIIVNPTHYAVALRYQPEKTDAPIIQARGRNAYAQRMRKVAQREGIVIVRNPRLARALYHEGRTGEPIGHRHFAPVADIYIMLRRSRKQQDAQQ